MPLPTMTPPPTAPSRSDDGTSFNSKADAFMAWFGTHVSEQTQWAAELPTTITGTDFAATSTSSVAIGTGSKSFTIQTGKGYQIGQSVRVAGSAAPANYMDGQVTAYNSGTGALTVNVTATGGSGTRTDWVISLAASSSAYLALSGGSLSGSLAVTGAVTATDRFNPGNDANYYLNINAGSPVINFDATDYLSYNRASNVLTAFVGGTSVMAIANALTTFNGAIKLAAASGSTAGNVGYSGGALSFGDGSAQRTVATLDGTQTFTNKTLTAPAINGATIDAATTVSDTGTIATTSVGFRGTPKSSNATGTLALADNGKVLSVSTNQTIPANASVAFPVGATIVLINNSASSITVAITSDTLRQAGTSNTGTRTLAAYGACTLIKESSTTWWIMGNVT